MVLNSFPTKTLGRELVVPQLCGGYGGILGKFAIGLAQVRNWSGLLPLKHQPLCFCRSQVLWCSQTWPCQRCQWMKLENRWCKYMLSLQRIERCFILSAVEELFGIKHHRPKQRKWLGVGPNPWWKSAYSLPIFGICKDQNIKWRAQVLQEHGWMDATD